VDCTKKWVDCTKKWVDCGWIVQKKWVDCGNLEFCVY
jgi:hypothetical protein